MEGDGSMHNSEERGAERSMDEYLKSIGLHRKKIAKDGSCLFRAVAEQVLHCQSLHTQVRAKCVEFLKENRESYEAFIEGDFEEYLFKLQDPQQWVGEVEINALAVMYKRDFLIFQEAGKPAVNITDNNFKDKVQLCFLNGNHYDSVYPISRVKSAALCQSILYELLYDGVFNADRSSLGPCQRAARASDLLSDDNMNVCVSSDESDLEAGDALWVESETSTTTTRHNNQSYRSRGRGRQLPERVRRSLNPTLFRNVAYDVWHKTKRAQQKMDYSIAAGMQFTVGDRCQVRLEGGGRVYSATIREVSPNNGPVTVYLEELGTRKQVPLWSLRPPNDESSWSTVVNRDKRLSNGHGDWEERGKGRGRGKNVLGSFSSVPGATATAPASSGRVQKQHSWPPQATVEEPGGAKASRKSVSSEFGLTEEQRLAKEEEERNVALVEIQLRDEHSFPALGVGILGDGGRRKGGDKRRCQGNKTKSPVEEVRTPSPSAGERPKSSTPPLSSTAAAAATNTIINTTTPTDPTLAAAPPVTSDSNDTNTHSSASAATPTSLPPLLPLPPAAPAAPAAAPITRPPAPGGAAPLSIPSSASLFLTPSLPAASSPRAPLVLSSSCPSSSSLPPVSSVSPPPSSSLPTPTFIAPIAPSPAAAQGFLPRSSPPVSSLSHSPSSPFFCHAAQVHEAPPASAPNSLLNIGGSLTAPQTFQTQISASQTQISASQTQISASQTQTQASLTQMENQTQPSLPQNTQIPIPHMQTEVQSCPPHLQHQPQPHPEVASLPQTQTQTSVSHLQQAQYLSRCQSEVAQVQSSHPAPGASYPLTSQASGPASVQPHPHLHVQPAQPPHPSQVPHPSLSLSASHPSLQSQNTQNTQNTQNQTESPLPPAQHPQPHPEPPSHPPPHPPHHPQLQSAPPPHHQSPVPAAVPLQQLSQLYQDPLYPGFPQGEKGEVAPTPPFSSSQSGDDLPQDLNILKFFFNLGVKAYTMHMFPPYLYLVPLQQAHTMHPKLPPRNPSPSQTPHYPSRHQESYQHPQYPPTSAPPVPPQYDHQAPLAEPPRPSEPSFTTAAGYPVTQPPPTHRLPWQQHQMPPLRNPGYPAGYPNPSASYRAPPPLSQGYHPGQTQGHPLYPSYPPSSLGYQSSTPEELQVSQGAMEQRQPANGDAMPGQGPGRESPAAANVANANRSVGVPGFGQKKELGDGMTRAVLLVDPPFNNTPIITMTTMNPGSSPGSPLAYDIISKTPVHGDNNPSRGYRGRRKPLHPTNNTYVPLGPAELPGYLPTAAMAESLSVGCSTEDNWDEASAGFKPTTLNYRGPRRNYRGRGRVGHDPGRGANRRRQGGEAGAGAGFSYVQFSSSHRGRGRERGY